MNNVTGPPGYTPPTTTQLLRSTLIALAAAGVILVTIVLPAEYGIDPTGVGSALGLKRVGEIKTQLAEEAAADAGHESGGTVVVTPPTHIAQTNGGGAAGAGEAVAEPPVATDSWRDRMDVVIEPDDAIELKLIMSAGEEVTYEWTTSGGALNFNAHGHGGGEKVTYGKGRDAPGAEGTLLAPFDGHHGWFWRNRTEAPVTLTLRTRGQYSELKRTR